MYENNGVEIINNAIDEVFASDDVSKYVEFEYKHHWYSDRIEMLPSHKHGSPWGEKARAKSKARTTSNISAILEDIKDACSIYKWDNYDILPTVIYLKRSTTYSNPTIRKYGKEYFISQAENTKQIVLFHINHNNNLTQAELSTLIKIPLSTIRRYSKYR